MTSVTFNKAVTVLEETNSGSKVFTFKKKADFFKWVSNCSSFEMFASVNINGVIKKLEAKGFSAVIDESFGFEWEAKITFNK